MMVDLDLQAALIEQAKAGDGDSGRAILTLLERHDLTDLVMVDGLLNAAERWIRSEISTGSNEQSLQLCGILVVKAGQACHAGSTEAAISYLGEALCILDVLADAGAPDAPLHMEKLTDWLGSSGLGEAAIKRAKAMRNEVTF